MRYEDLDEALKRQPLWEPPAGFARAVVARIQVRNHPQPAIEQRFFDLLRGAELAVVCAAVVSSGAWILWRVTPLLTDTLVANALPVAWACAIFSLAVAASLTPRARGWL